MGRRSGGNLRQDDAGAALERSPPIAWAIGGAKDGFKKNAFSATSVQARSSISELRGSRAAQYQFLPAGMAVGPHHDQTGIEIAREG